MWSGGPALCGGITISVTDSCPPVSSLRNRTFVRSSGTDMEGTRTLRGAATARRYPSFVASRRQIDVGGVKIGGGAPVAVQSMTKTETADYDATLKQIRAIADAGADLVRVAVPREKDVEALKRLVVESPIPVIADIHFNHTLALKAIDAGAHCVRLNPGNIGGPDKVAEVAEEGQGRRRADADRRQLRLAPQAPARAREARTRSRRWSRPPPSSSS